MPKARDKTDKPRKKLQFRDPEVEESDHLDLNAIALKTQTSYTRLGAINFGVSSEPFILNDCSPSISSAASYGKPVSSPSTLSVVENRVTPRRQSLIQLPPITAVLQSRGEDIQGLSPTSPQTSSTFEQELKRLLAPSPPPPSFSKGRKGTPPSPTLVDNSSSSQTRNGMLLSQDCPEGSRKSSNLSNHNDPVENDLTNGHPIENYADEREDDDDGDDWDGDVHAVINGSLEDVYLESQAMRIVRTVGQAFEVCHKLSLQHSQQVMDGQEDAISERSSDAVSEKNRKNGASDPNSCDTQTEEIPQENSVDSAPARPTKLEPIPPPPITDPNKAPLTEGETYASPMSKPLPAFDTLPSAGTPLSTHHQVQLLGEQLEQQQQQTQVAIAQVHLLRDQLAAETSARLEAQARTHQLLVHNKELLDHIHNLVIQVQELEGKLQGLDVRPQEYSYLQQMSIMCDPTTPSPGPVSLPDFQEAEACQHANNLPDQALYENRSLSAGFEPASPVQLVPYASPIPPYTSGGVSSGGATTPLHYSGSLSRSPSLRLPPTPQPQLTSESFSILQQHRQNLQNSSSFYGNSIGRTSSATNFYRSPSVTNANSAMTNNTPQSISPMRMLQDDCNANSMNNMSNHHDPRLKVIVPLPLQDASGNRLDLGLPDNLGVAMPKLNPPPQRKKSTRQSQSHHHQQQQAQNENLLSPTDAIPNSSSSNHNSLNSDETAKQRLQVGNSMMVGRSLSCTPVKDELEQQMNKQNKDSMLSVQQLHQKQHLQQQQQQQQQQHSMGLTQQALFELSNLSLGNSDSSPSRKQQFISNGPYILSPRSAPSQLTTYMDDTNLERLGRMQRMTWTRHTVGK